MSPQARAIQRDNMCGEERERKKKDFKSRLIVFVDYEQLLPVIRCRAADSYADLDMCLTLTVMMSKARRENT